MNERRLSPWEFYEQVEVGDTVELYWPDRTREVEVDGVMLASGDDPRVSVLSRGMLFSLHEGHSARIVQRRSAIRSRW